MRENPNQTDYASQAEQFQLRTENKVCIGVKEKRSCHLNVKIDHVHFSGILGWEMAFCGELKPYFKRRFETAP